MFKCLVFAGITLFIFSGCASKKVEQGSDPNAAISSDAMSFDPQGSDSGKIDGLMTVHFDFDRASLGKKEKEILLKNAEWMKAHSQFKVQIEGHCDSKGSTEYNLALGERRANVARRYLIDLGIKPERISTVSYGKERPLTNDEGDEAQAKNRRANFVPGKAL